MTRDDTSIGTTPRGPLVNIANPAHAPAKRALGVLKDKRMRSINKESTSAERNVWVENIFQGLFTNK